MDRMLLWWYLLLVCYGGNVDGMLMMCCSTRTGSKLGISPLMLAAMNGHTSTVKLLLDKGSDINAQVSSVQWL